MAARLPCCSFLCSSLLMVVVAIWCLCSQYFLALDKIEFGAISQLADVSFIASKQMMGTFDPPLPRQSGLKVVAANSAKKGFDTTNSRHKNAASAPLQWRALDRQENVNSNSRGFSCDGRYVYMYKLPEEFNQEMLEHCAGLSIWTNMCPHVANGGLGQPLNDESLGLSSERGWYSTNQFATELIFHESMKKYECLTEDSAIATAFYVPFYAGFDMSRHVGEKNLTLRDEAGKALDKWLQQQPQWKATSGRNHFMVAGRITWDFMRSAGNGWGNNLLLLPSITNMSILLIEAHPWHDNEHGIPYPTYFHPSKASDVLHWQELLRHSETRREILFAFVGGVKRKNLIRDKVIEQCSQSSHCQILECGSSSAVDCYDPLEVMKLFLNSVFCLQPRGDSFTRRSIFDSMLAGCVPVFFTEHSAYTQYQWHLPANRSSYSVFIPESELVLNHSIIEEKLKSVSPSEIQSMQEKIIETVPSLVYADPEHQAEVVDAFGVAIRGIVHKIKDSERPAGMKKRLRISIPRKQSKKKKNTHV